MKRYGFPIVSDFAVTVHAVTGGTLRDDVDSTPSHEDALKAYIVISRVERAEHILASQPCSTALFRQGPFEAADLFLKALRGDILKEKLQETWATVDARKAKHKN